MPSKCVKIVLILLLAAVAAANTVAAVAPVDAPAPADPAVAVATPAAPASIVREKNIAKVHIGVLANNGKATAIRTWQPLIDYLEGSIPEHRFVLVPLDFEELYSKVKAKHVDFIITNTGQYIELEAYYGVSRIATLRNAGPGGFNTKYGGVIFVRADRNDIYNISDFPGRKVLATNEGSFGGWLMQLREIKSQGIDPDQFAEFKTTGNHEAVVFSILEGNFDIGIVRTDTLERMAVEDKIDLSAIRIINKQYVYGFPFRLSTRLYPEWPFAKVAHTDSLLARDVAIALLTLPDNSPAAQAAQSGGWTIPEDYNTVHELFRELKIGPYQHLGEFDAVDVITKYWHVTLLSALLLIITATSTVWAFIAKRHLGKVLADLNISHTELEKANDLLMENMQYAQIIQESLLPDQQVLGEFVADLAVLWEPLDLVGGDYYWMGLINGKACIMVADCTGHGVPGALLTVALSSSLDSIHHEGKLTNPGQILTEIDRTLRRKLRQDENGSTSDDGLEAAFCIYDPHTRTLEFAGARLPLLWIKEGKAHLIKGDRSYLGYRTSQLKSPFKVHVFEAEPDTTFYMFTDGITNQIGGIPRRLFGQKRLADLLTWLNRYTLDEQMPAIKKHLQFYRQNEEPRDDMTLIGFRFNSSEDGS